MPSLPALQAMPSQPRRPYPESWVRHSFTLGKSLTRYKYIQLKLFWNIRRKKGMFKKRKSSSYICMYSPCCLIGAWQRTRCSEPGVACSSLAEMAQVGTPDKPLGMSLSQLLALFSRHLWSKWLFAYVYTSDPSFSCLLSFLTICLLDGWPWNPLLLFIPKVWPLTISISTSVLDAWEIRKHPPNLPLRQNQKVSLQPSNLGDRAGENDTLLLHKVHKLPFQGSILTRIEYYRTLYHLSALVSRK